MTIKNAQAYVDSLWNWSILEGCFVKDNQEDCEKEISPSDIDGVVAYNGHVLFIETKPPNAPIPEGQRILHETLVSQGNSVIIVWGNTNYPRRIRWLRPGIERNYEPAGIQTLRNICTKWFEWAKENKVA